jgi:hypothetical protein
MKRALIVSIPVLLAVGFFVLPVIADDTLVRFRGGIGVIPVSNVAGDPVIINNVTTFPNVTRNVVRGVNPAGQIWVISDLDAKVKTNGDIEVKGEGLLLGGGNNIGTNGGQSVAATLFCGPVGTPQAFSTAPGVPLEPNGDFTIKDTLDNLPLPAICANPLLLIRSFNNETGIGAWFAAGIPKLD